MTILDFAKKIVALTDCNSQIVFKPLPVDDPRVRQPDITRAKRLLGWQPKVDFESGVRETIGYFKQKLGL
jgi:dTDP-glucose 4,6-dehydratase